MRRIFRALLLLPLILVVSACSTTTKPRVEKDEKVERDDPKITSGPNPAVTDAMVKDMIRHAITSAKASNGAPQSKSKAATLLETGIALSDYECSEFFDALALGQQKLGFGRQILSLVGVATNAILGLSGASAGTVSVVATVFGFGSASKEAFQREFIFSPDVKSMRTLVGKAQNAVKAQFDKKPPNSYPRAFAAIKYYHSLCQVDSIKSLVNQAVAVGKVKAFTGAVESFLEAVSKGTRRQLATAVGSPALTDDVILHLYWLVAGAPTEEERKDVLYPALAGLPKPPLLPPDGKRNDGASGPKWKDVNDAIRLIRDSAGATLDEEIRKVRAARDQAKKEKEVLDKNKEAMQSERAKKLTALAARGKERNSLLGFPENQTPPSDKELRDQVETIDKEIQALDDSIVLMGLPGSSQLPMIEVE